MKKLIYWKVSAFCYLYFFSLWVFYAFLPIWLSQKLNLTGMQIGMIFGVNSILCMAVQPIYGYVSDKIGMKRYLLAIITLLIALTGPFFVFVYKPLFQSASWFYLGVLIEAIVMAFTFNCAGPAIESYIDKCSRIYNFEFGRSRAWGSFGAASGVFCAGISFNWNAESIFWIASATSILMALVLYTVHIDESKADFIKDESINIKDVKHLFRLKDVWLFMLFILGSSCVYIVYDQQFAVYYASFFPTVEEGNQAYGYLGSLQIFLEGGCMFLAPVIVNKIGAKHGMLLGAGIMAFRMVASGLVGDPVSISLVKLMHSLELAVWVVSVFKYMAKNFDTRLSSVMYLVGYQLPFQLGAAILSPIVGELYDSIGFKDAYLLLGSIVIAAIIFGAFMLVSDRRIPKEKQQEIKNYIKKA